MTEVDILMVSDLLDNTVQIDILELSDEEGALKMQDMNTQDTKMLNMKEQNMNVIQKWQTFET